VCTERSPGTNDLVSITYVVTLGQDGNNIIATNQKIVMDGNTDVSGTPTANATGGGNEPDYIVYKNVTPALFGAFDSAVTGSQYKALPLQYPGVIDARVLSQREVNPYALTYMNVMKVSLAHHPVRGVHTRVEQLRALLRGRARCTARGSRGPTRQLST
jgi:hypothetical protein